MNTLQGDIQLWLNSIGIQFLPICCRTFGFHQPTLHYFTQSCHNTHATTILEQRKPLTVFFCACRSNDTNYAQCERNAHRHTYKPTHTQWVHIFNFMNEPTGRAFTSRRCGLLRVRNYLYFSNRTCWISTYYTLYALWRTINMLISEVVNSQNAYQNTTKKHTPAAWLRSRKHSIPCMGWVPIVEKSSHANTEYCYIKHPVVCVCVRSYMQLCLCRENSSFTSI